jgi:ATPase subunit of ABC transporter with duplicated ATPase domains
MAGMGHVQVSHLDYYLPDGRLLLSDVSFRVGQGNVAALVGPNGAGKTTLLRLASGELKPDSGTVTTSGGLGVMPQFVGSVRDERTVRDLLVSVARPGIRGTALAVDAAELAIMERDDEAAQMAYAQALSDWADAGGYAAETTWDMCTMSALGVPFEKAQWRQVRTLSGGEQKRLVLEALLRGPEEVLLLDEPDNYLDVPGKQWLEGQLRETGKTVLFISHDRELLTQAASTIVSVEPRAAPTYGSTAAASPRSTRHASSGSNGSRNCAAAGTRNTPSSGASSWTCSSTPPAATRWPPATPPPRPGCGSSRRPARRQSRPASRTSGCDCGEAAPAPAPSPAGNWS